jgi:hypothetical protein
MTRTLLKGVRYAWEITFTDGHQETALAHTQEQAERIAYRKRYAEGGRLDSAAPIEEARLA